MRPAPNDLLGDPPRKLLSNGYAGHVGKPPVELWEAEGKRLVVDGQYRRSAELVSGACDWCSHGLNRRAMVLRRDGAVVGGLMPIITTLSTLAGGFAQWAFGRPYQDPPTPPKPEEVAPQKPPLSPQD